jgi:lipopolysaccharide transport system ATP-binding protein
MHARLAFAVCANVDADVLIVDEVLSVGDAAFQQKCMRFLNRFRLHGTLLFVSHDSGTIVKLCDRALWLDQGVVRGFGDAKEMCRLYLAAQAEEAADNLGKFQIAGRAQRLVPSEPVQSEAESPARPKAVFTFDADEDWKGCGDGAIEFVKLFSPKDSPLQIATGGEEVELKIGCGARRSIGHPVVAFAWRDRLGQVLFSDDTFANCPNASSGIREGRRFVASFSFRLPYLSTGAYAIEAFLFDAGEEIPVPLGRERDALLLHVHSRHIFQQGLLNIGMRAVVVRRAGAGSGPAEKTVSFENTTALIS